MKVKDILQDGHLDLADKVIASILSTSDYLLAIRNESSDECHDRGRLPP